MPPKKIKLTKRKREWVGNRTINLKGLPLPPNVGIENKYSKRLNKLVNDMNADVSRQVKTLFRGDAAKEFAQDASISSAFRILMSKLFKKYESIFAESAKRNADWLAKQSNSHSEKAVGASLKELSGGLTIKTDYVSGPLKEIVNASISENVGLIKTIQKNYFEKIEGDVYRAIASHESGGITGLQAKIQESLSARYKQQKNKAKNIALDQTRKLYNNMNAERMKSAGTKQFVWHHAGGSKEPRRDHIEMNGNIYSFDDLPVIDKKTGEKGIPGQAINCKCFMSPVISFE